MTPLPSQTDYELLQMYSRGSQPAFAELVRRHVDWVYSAARRQVRDPHLAEDVTQAVFLILSQKAPSFGPAIILPAWLHRAARYCAANALRAQNVRRHHESRAAEMAVKQPDQIGTLDELIDRPQLLVLLDRAIGTLGGTDQKAIVLHYFQGKTHADVAVALGLSSDAASKRIQRALTKLHGILARSGQPTNMASLAAGVLARATRPAPAHLAGAIASNIAGKTAALQVSLTIANKAVKGMFWSHLKAAAAIGMLAIAATAGISSAVVMLAQNDAKPANPAAPAGAAAAQAVIAAAAAIPPAPARATAVIVSVVDADGGGAIAGASVSKLISGAMSNAYSVDSTLLPIGTTDAAGQISLTCDPAERTAFLVTAKGKTPHAFGFWGCVPDAYQVSLAKPLHTFGGQVLDDAGKPIADAPVSVRVYDFQLAESANRRDVPLLSYPLSARTDSSGRFSLAAPDGDADGVSVQISREWVCVARQGKYIDAIPVDQNLRDGSFVGHPLPTAPPFAPPHVTTPPPVTLHMRVLDADTGKPILHYRVTPGGSSNPTQLFQAMPGSALEMTRPEVTWTFYDGSWSYFLRVEADGYAATPTRMVRSSEKQADLEVKLNRAFPITVTVRTPRGEPAAGAVVYLATPTLLQSYVTRPVSSHCQATPHRWPWPMDRACSNFLRRESHTAWQSRMPMVAPK